MKINELRRPSDLKTAQSRLVTDFDWLKVIDSFFEKYGFTMSGAGYYGYVAIKKGYPYAIKVFKSDAGYTAWYKFCRRHQNNPFVPQFKGKIIKMVEDFYYVRLEKLLPTHQNEKRSELNQLFIDTLFRVDSHWAEYYDDPETAKHAVNNFKFTGVTHIDVIAEELLNNFDMLDLGFSNIMKRENGTPVLIDPYAGDD